MGQIEPLSPQLAMHTLLSYNSLAMICLLLLFGVIGWLVYLVNVLNKFKQEQMYAKNVFLLSHKAWAAVRKKTGVIEFQTGLSSYASPHYPVKNLSDFNHFWDVGDQARWIDFLQQIDLEPWEMKTITLSDVNRNRRIQIQSYITQKNFQDIYFFVLSDVTVNLSRLESELVKNNALVMVQQMQLKHLDILPFPVWHRDIHTNLTFCNQAYVEACGMTSAAIIHENYCLWTIGRDDVDFPLYLKPLKKQVTIQGEKRLYQFFEFHDKTSQSYYGYAIDLTENENIKDQFKRHIAAYREILNNISTGVTIYGSDHRMKYFNQSYVRMYDMDQKWLATEPTVGEVLDHLRARNLLPQHIDYASFKNHEIQNITMLTGSRFELVHLLDTRSIRKMSAPHPLGGNFYLFEDMTAAVTLERQLHTQIEVQRATLDSLYEGIAVFDSHHRLRLINPAFTKLWHVDEPSTLHNNPHISDLLERVRDQFHDVSDWQHYKLRLIARVTDGIPKKRRVVRKDGTVVDFSYMPMPDGSHLISYIDVTDKFKMENLLKSYQEAVSQIQLAQQNVTDSMLSMSTEFYNPQSHDSINSRIFASESIGKVSKQ